MPSVLPGIKDRKTAEGYMGEVLYYNPEPERIAWVFGDTLEELRDRKHIVTSALAHAIVGSDECACVSCAVRPRGHKARKGRSE